jgi:KaiC/GvpD/RAD55 family RecA-like ATPase
MSAVNGHGDADRIRNLLADLLVLSESEPAERVMAEAKLGFERFAAGEPDAPDGLRSRAGIGPQGDRNLIRAEWTPVRLASATASTEQIPWVWQGYIARGFTTSLTGVWKSGKTTLLSHLLAALERGTPFCRQEVTHGRALIVSEENAFLWVRRRNALGFGEAVDLISRPFRSRPTPHEWKRFMTYLAEYVSEQKVALVAFDSLPNLWPVADENDAAQVITALTPLNALTAAGCAVLLLMHPSKSDQTEGRATRGSGALGGFVDVIVEMRRFDPEHHADTRRVLRAFSRFEETPAEVVVSFKNGSYLLEGTLSEARGADRLSVVFDLLRGAGRPLTAEELLFTWPTSEMPRPSLRTLRRDLADAVRRGFLNRAGDGHRQNPSTYSLPGSTPEGARP